MAVLASFRGDRVQTGDVSIASRHLGYPRRKVSPGLPEDMAQLRAEGLTYAEIARRFGMLESQIRLLVRKLSSKSRSTSNSRRIDWTNLRSELSIPKAPKVRVQYPDNRGVGRNGFSHYSCASIQHTEQTSGGASCCEPPR